MNYKRVLSEQTSLHITDIELLSIYSTKMEDSIFVPEYDVIEDRNHIVNVETVNALWDTGASLSCIHPNLVEKLKPIYYYDTKIILANGYQTVMPVYVLAVRLDNILFPNVEVVELSSMTDDFIIGWSILGYGSVHFNKLEDIRELCFELVNRNDDMVLRQENVNKVFAPYLLNKRNMTG